MIQHLKWMHAELTTFIADTLSPATSTEIPTVTGNLFSQGTITANVIGVSFEPTTSDTDVNGELTWGKLILPFIFFLFTQSHISRWN